MSVDEEVVLDALDRVLTECDDMITQKAQTIAYHKAVQESADVFRERVRTVCTAAMQRRDREVVRTVDRNGSSGLRALELLGGLTPPWFDWRTVKPGNAIRMLEHQLEASRHFRQHSLAQRGCREVNAARQIANGDQGFVEPSACTIPEMAHVLQAEDVARLREGAAIVIDPDPPLLPPAEMSVAEADLRRLWSSAAVNSDAPCNSGAMNAHVPWCSLDEKDAAKFPMAAETRILLKRLAAIASLIEQHGWTRRLMVPVLLQLACYSAGTGARYTTHLDRWGWEKHNRREVTVLLYLNSGWDESCGGKLVLHPNAPGEGGACAIREPVEVAPISGRVVVFPSGTQKHEVLPATRGQRMAITLWVEYRDDV